MQTEQQPLPPPLRHTLKALAEAFRESVVQRRIACRSILHERAERPVSRLRAIGGEYGDIRQIFLAAADKISPLGQQPQLVLEIRQRHPELDTELIGRNRAVIRSK